jgi:SAM-dependent methyltransferase
MSQSSGQERESSDAKPRSAYALGRDRLETERLERQSDELRPQTVALLQRVEGHDGGSALDLGCGPAGALALLAEWVGPTGRVLGLDNDPAHVALARTFAHEHGLSNVEVLQADADRTGLPASSFDVAHARALLVNIPDPATVVTEMVRLVKPAGYVLVQEPDPGCRICYPPDPAWTRLADIYQTVFQRDGADLFIGRRLPTLLREAGLVEVGVEARADIYPLGHSGRTRFPDLVRSLRPTILAQGLLSEAEFDALDHAVRAHLDNPDVLVLPHLYFLACGRKPAHLG